MLCYQIIVCHVVVCRVPTPVAVAISAAVFALAHLTPGQFPQLFVLGISCLSYSHFIYGYLFCIMPKSLGHIELARAIDIVKSMVIFVSLSN